MDADARAREVNRRIHVDCQAPYCGCKDGFCGVSENYIAAALREVERETVERCAKVAEDIGYDRHVGQLDVDHDLGWFGHDVADAIRALVDERRAAKEDGRG